MTSRHVRAYRALLVAYPTDHRREYGEPMEQLFADRMRDDGGGAGTMVVWAQMLVDLVRTAFAERLETSMKWLKSGWWRILAPLVSVFTAVAGLGLPFEEQESAGPNWRTGAIAYAVVTVIGLALVVSGLTIRKRNRKVGSTMIAVGVMPAFPMTLMFWFPPVALVGVVSIVISLTAFLDAPKAPQSVVEPVS